jgi:HK97 family phage prohead protease
MSLTRRVVPFETKAVTEDRSFEGYGSVFGVLDSYDDVVAKGAFAKSLRGGGRGGRTPALLWQHDAKTPIGVYTDMREDDTGLFVKGRFSKTAKGDEAYELLKDGALSGLSIGFTTSKAQMDEKTGVRTLTEVDLWEVSLVTFPANQSARVTGVKADGSLPTEREFEEFLRDAGFTRNHAKFIISKGYRLTRRDAMPSDDACGELAELIVNSARVATGVDAHGNHGSQSRT